MDIWLDMIRDNNLYKAAHPASTEEIESAEQRLGLVFSRDYKAFLSSIGACICFGHEIKGISDNPNLDVVRSTEEVRNHFDLVPHGWYVIEDTYIDGIVILQDKNGIIYQMTPETSPVKITYNLESYLAEAKAGIKREINAFDSNDQRTISGAELEKEAEGILKQGYEEAKRKLEKPDQVEKVLQELEKKLDKIPGIGDWLADVPAVISLIRSYIRKEYKDVPVASIIAALAAVIYVVSPVDLIPDVIPAIGVLDDAVVFVACWKLIHNDIDKYQEWRKQAGKEN